MGMDKIVALQRTALFKELDGKTLGLLAEARRYGARTEMGMSINLTYTNQQIAARIGTVREVVSRALTRLQHEGLIVLEGRVLIIPDEDALSAFAGQQ
jgi:CRP-like cAMP-binding protein